MLFFVNDTSTSPIFGVVCAAILFINLSMACATFSVPVNTLTFSVAPDKVRHAGLFNMDSVIHSILNTLPRIFITNTTLLPCFGSRAPRTCLASTVVSTVKVIFLAELACGGAGRETRRGRSIPTIGSYFTLLFGGEPLLVLFVNGVFFIVYGVTRRISFCFITSLVFGQGCGVFVSIIGFPNFLFTKVLIPGVVRSLNGGTSDGGFCRNYYITTVVLRILFTMAYCGKLVGGARNADISLFINVLIILFAKLATVPLRFGGLVRGRVRTRAISCVR